MVSDGEQHPLASHSLETGREFDFADGECVSEMETSVHVRVRKRAEPFWVFFLQFLHRLIRFEKLCIRRYALWKRWRISVEEVAFLPVFLNAVLDVHQIVPLVGLYQSSAQVSILKLTFSMTTTEPAEAFVSMTAAILKFGRACAKVRAWKRCDGRRCLGKMGRTRAEYDNALILNA